MDAEQKKRQADRIKLMRTIAQETAADTKDTFVLKGGTALLLAYGLNRFSEDMDFDGRQRVDLRQTIERAAKKCGHDCEIIIKKDTETTQRYSIHYGAEQNGQPYPLKVECSYRQRDEINEKDIIRVDGIRVYSIQKLAEQKSMAFINRDTVRDTFDIHFLLKNHPDVFTKSMLIRLETGINQKGINNIAENYEYEKVDDHILQKTDGEKIVLEIEQAIKDINKNIDFHKKTGKQKSIVDDFER